MVFLSEYHPWMDQLCQGTYNLGDPNAGFYYFQGWVGISVLALLASLMILVFLYMLAIILQNQGFIALVKVELYEFIVTAAIFIVLFMLLGGVCNVKTGWLFPDAGHKVHVGPFQWISTSWYNESIYYSSTNYLTDFADYTLEIMSFQYLVYTFVDFVTTTEIAAVPMGIGMNLKPTLGIGAVIKPVMNNAFTAELISVVTSYAQTYVLDYGSYGLLTYFLPLAFLMRSFVYTRRIGGTLIAIICVFLFIYPLLVIMTYSMVNEPLQGRLAYFEQFLSQLGLFKFSILLLLKFALKWLWSAEFLMSYALLTIPTVATIFIGGVFIPLFNSIILITTARHLSKILGEEIDITNLTRMI